MNICLGIAAAMRFDSDSNAVCNDVMKMIDAEGPEAVLKNICSLSEKDVIWNIILDFYRLLGSNMEINAIMEMVEVLKRRRSG